MADDVDLERLAVIAIGFSGAGLANLENEAAPCSSRHRQFDPYFPRAL